ncbi:site-specific tyrosine recombinase XerC [Caulifigura coniformis]|uniref:Site-specific tyrosine recombinase XerC n=1 Tax=Caulifigura coniformis TaxID=2527983 RepID=A0A517SBU7_9PLAN|nr:tyrosine-type recombinase/integrase [Caulifigura coniformis]QDT53610.1 site-specific tyrosine recombinase XerC [Caulifigura coniformis]
MNKPFYRRQRGVWAVRIDGKLVTLGHDKTEAWKRWHELSAAPRVDSPIAAEIIDWFLAWSEDHQAGRTTKFYRFFLDTFKPMLDRLTVADLKPFHVSRWLDKRSYTGTTGNCGVRAVTRPFSWAVKQGIIERNPLHGAERPSASPRECYLADAQLDAILKAIPDREFQDFVEFARETGARPQEIRAAEKRHFQNGTLTFPRAESKGKRRQRVIVLNAKALAIVQRLAVKHPEGPLFRNTDGAAWTAFALNCRCRKLRAKLGFAFCCYAVRHTWITNALLNGVEPLTVATLAGHVNINMIWSTYQKLSMQQDHMRAAAEQASRRKQA